MRRVALLLTAAIAACEPAEPPPAQAEVAPPEEEPSVERIGAFEFRPRLDPMTDEDRSMIVTEDVTSTLIRTPALIWRCAGPEVELYLSADDYIQTGPIQVQWRLDDSPATEPRTWGASTTGTSAFAPDAELVAFTDAALSASRVRMRVEDYQGTAHDHEFSVEGLGAALDRLGCGVPPARQRLAEAEAAAARAAAENQRWRDSVAAFAVEWAFVGHRSRKVYLPNEGACWRQYIPDDRAVYFKTSQEAEAEGYQLSSVCIAGRGS